jgi:CysZ protein
MIQNIFKGIKAYMGTFKLISTLGLWKYFAIPVLISLGTAILIGFSAWGWSDNIATVIDKAWMWEWGAEGFHTLAEVLGGLFILIIGLIVYKHIVMALSAPFMSPVSSAIEHHLLGEQHTHRETSNGSQLWRGVRINVRNLGMEILITIPLVLLSLIPILNIITAVLIFLVQAYYAGFGNMDYTLERHYGYKESIQFVKRNRGVAIGNGILFIAMLIIPVIGVILVLPLSVTASTTETIRLIQEKK